jgi:hypothetical protein
MTARRHPFRSQLTPRQIIGKRHPASIEELQAIARRSTVPITRLPDGDPNAQYRADEAPKEE